MRIVEINILRLDNFTCHFLTIFRKITWISTFTLVALMGCSKLLKGQCSGNLIFNENQDLDSFRVTQGNCQKFLGSITITGDFTAIDGLFEVFDTMLTLNIIKSHIDSFIMPAGNLVYSYAVKNNQNLKKVSFQNAEDHKAVLDGIFVEKNPQLTEIKLDVSSLFNFYVKTDTLLNVVIQRNAQIRHHATSGNITYSGAKFKLWYQYDLEVNDSLSSFTRVLDHFILDSIENIRIFNRKKFDCSGVEGIRQINALFFWNIDSLSLQGFEGSKQRINLLYIRDCPNIRDFVPMADTEAKSISLTRIPDLVTLNGLPVSKEMTGLFLVENGKLENIDRLNEVEAFVDDFIEFPNRVGFLDNPKISFCSYPAICDLVVNLGSPYVNISGNVMDCMDNESAKAACITSTADHGFELEKWVVVSDQNILFLKDDLKSAKMYDSSGKLVWYQNAPTNSYNLDLTSFNGGLYLMQLQDAEGAMQTIKWVIVW